MYVCTYVRTSTCVSMGMCRHVCTCVCMRAYIDERIDASMHQIVHVCSLAWLRMCGCMDGCTRVCMYVCVHACTYVCTYVDAFACFCLSCFCCPAVMLAAELVRCIELRRKTCAPKCFEPVNPKVWFIGFRESPTVSL